MTLWERLQLADWRIEIFTLTFCVVFAALYKFGDVYNTRKVTLFLEGVRAVMEENFHQYGVTPTQLYIKDSAENFSAYASGRDHIAKVNMDFTLAARQNVFVFIMEFCFSFFTEAVEAPRDKVHITITPLAEYENFISAVVSKLGMNDHRKNHYFLSLTKTTDSPELPETFVFMSEANEFQEKTLTAKLAQALTVPMASYLDFVAFTDQPKDAPVAIKDLMPRRRIVLSLDLVTGSTELAQVSQLLAAVFDVVDKIADKEITFKTETFRKIIRAREAEIAKLQRLQEIAKQEDEAEEKAKLRRQEKDKLRALSREEQARAEKKAQEKQARKAQKKMRVRG